MFQRKRLFVIVFKEDWRAESPKNESYIFDDADEADVPTGHSVVPEISNLEIL